MDFRLSDQAEYGNNAKTHKGFTGYLFGTHKRDVKERTYLKRIIASVNEAMEKYPEYKVYITGYVHHRSLSLSLFLHVYIYYCIVFHCILILFPTLVTLAIPLVVVWLICLLFTWRTWKNKIRMFVRTSWNELPQLPGRHPSLGMRNLRRRTTR